MAARSLLSFAPILVVAFGVTVVVSDPARAATLNVPADYPTIQAAIDAANPGDAVMVDAGIYDQTTTRAIPKMGDITAVVFIKSGVDVIAESGPGSTIIDRVDGPQTTVFAVAAYGLDASSTTIEGFTIRAMDHGTTMMEVHPGSPSASLNLRNLVFDSRERDIRGLRARSINMVVTDCTFRKFTRPSDGGFTYGVDHTLVRSLTVERCLFEEGIGSGLRVTTSTIGSSTLVEMTIRDCTFRSLPMAQQGALYLEGEIDGSVENCVFEDTVARVNFGGSTGGIYAVQASSAYPLRIHANVFINSSTDAAGGAGAITCATFTQTYQIIGNTILGCSAPNGDASAIKILSSSPNNQLRNNVIAHCQGPPEAVFVDGAVQSDCNVFWSNVGGDAAGFSFGPQDQVTDPYFCDIESRNLTVRSDSPCLPENSGGCGLIGAYGQGCGIVSVGSSSWGRIKTLFRR